MKNWAAIGAGAGAACTRLVRSWKNCGGGRESWITQFVTDGRKDVILSATFRPRSALRKATPCPFLHSGLC